MDFAFKKEHSFDVRRIEADNIRKNYPNRVPVIVEKAPGSKLPRISKRKYLVPVDITAGQFFYLIRQKLQISSEEALFFFANHTIASSSLTMGQLYTDHHDEDFFLYMTYSEEQVYG